MVKKNVKLGINMADDVLKLCDKYVKITGVKSRSAFIESAVKDHISRLVTEQQKDILAPQLAGEIVKASEAGVTKISKGLFRYAVEVEILTMILSEIADVPAEIMEEYRHEAVNNVRRTRGKINLDDLIQRNNREFAKAKIEQQPDCYSGDILVVNEYNFDDELYD